MISWNRPGFCDGFSIPRMDIFVTTKMARLGEKIARNPLQFIGFSLLLSALFATGLQQIAYESDPSYLFVPTGARALNEQLIINKWFPNKMNRFVRGGETRLPTSAELAVIPLEGENVMRPEIWKECYQLAKAIHTIQVWVDEERYMWNSLCARFDGKCLSNDYLDLHSKIGLINISYPLMQDPNDQNKFYPMLAYLGGTDIDENDHVRSARAIKLSFIMESSTETLRKASRTLSQTIRMYATSINFKHIQVYSVTDMSIEEELSYVIDGSISKIPITIVVVVAFAVYNCLSTDWVRSKPLIGVMTVIVAALSFCSASGLALYLGIKWQAINIITLSLTLGIGLDDCFVLLSAWWRSETSAGRDVVSRMSATFSDAAVSITITSVTNVVSFLVGAAIPGFPSVRIFCFYAGLCMTFLYFWSLFILGASLTLAGHLEHANRHCLLFIKVNSKSETEMKRNWLYSVFLQGGVGKKDVNNPRDHKEGKLMSYFRDYLAPFINKPVNKALIIIVFLAYLGASIYGILKLEDGLERRKLVGHNSYAKPFFDTEDKFFRDNPYRFQIVIDEPIEYWNKTVRDQYFDIVHELEDTKFILADSKYRQSWLHQFMNKVEENFVFFDISTQEKFVHNVIKFLEVLEDTPLYDDVIISSDNKTIQASRFFLQSGRIKDATEEVKLLHTLRKIADSAPFKVTIFHPYFSFFDQFAQVTRTTIECITACIMCMTIITIIFIPDKRSIIWVTFTIISVELGIVGFMALIGIRLDVISMIVIIMGIGFSVDFSAHISYHYLTAGTDMAPSIRVEHCLYALGPPIVRGGLSTILGVIGLYFHPSYITETFATMIFLIILLGTVHSLLLLPVLLSLFGPGSSSKGSDIKFSSPSQLSETFTYQASVTPHFGIKKKTESLRKLVLSTGFKNSGGKPENLNNSETSLSSWYPTSMNPNQQAPDFHNYVMQRVTSSDLTKLKQVNSPEGVVGAVSPENPNPLPYYKFAHVKRSVRPLRNASSISEMEDKEKLEDSFDSDNSWEDFQDVKLK